MRPGEKRGVAAALAVVAAAASLVATTAPAAAAVAVTCATTARIFTVQADGDLWLYEHATPEAGDFTWTGVRQIGWGWGGRTLAGPDGLVYNFTDAGDLRRFHWRGSHWEEGPNGAFTVMRDGSRLAPTAAGRDLITVDALGDFYAIQGDNLVFGAVNAASASVAVPDVVATGFSGYDYLVASGPGVLYARTRTGELHRFRYHRDSDRFHETGSRIGVGWDNLHNVVGVGGGVLYGVQHSGNMYWNRDAAEHDRAVEWAEVNGRVVGYDWANDLDTVGSPQECTRNPEPGPAAPVPTTEPTARTSVVEVQGGLRTFHTTSTGRLVQTVEQADGSFDAHAVSLGGDVAVHDGFVPAVASGDQSRALAVTHRPNGDFDFSLVNDFGTANTLPARALSPTSAELIRRANGSSTAYFVDGDGGLWSQTGSSGVPSRIGVGPWRQVAHDAGFGERVAALPLGDGSVVVAGWSRTAAGPKLVWERDGRAVKEITSPGVPVTGTPAIVQENETTVRVFLRGAGGELLTATVRGDTASAWTAVPGITIVGSPSAVTLPGGRVEVVVRSTTDEIRRASQQAPGGAFGAWDWVGTQLAGSDPTVVLESSGTRAVVYRDRRGQVLVYRYTAQGFTGGPVA